MIERHVSFAVLPDRTTDFEQFFTERYRPPVLEMPGLIECILLREAEHPERYQMVFRWEAAEQAVAWRVSPVHQALQPELGELHEGMEIVAFAQVA
jgi:heme-degrading monooxygenase HmoA